MIRNEVRLAPVDQKKTMPKDALLLDCESSSFRRVGARLMGLYLITAEGECFLEKRYVVEKKEDEYDLLLALIEALQDKKTVISFNGTSFDIPFLKKRLAAFGLLDPFPGKDFLDLYLLLHTLDRFFALPDRKLISYLSLLPDVPSCEDDAQRAFHLLDLMPLRQLFDGAYEIKEVKKTATEDALCFSMTIPQKSPLPLQKSDTNFELALASDFVTLYAPLYEGKLRVYYPDIKNYEYLPAEGYAIHKSVADMVDKSRIEKARRETCFTLFAPGEEFFADREMQKTYVDSVLRYLIE